MVKSMTGFGKVQSITELGEINIEIKSVNNRYSDVNIRLPRFLNFAEERIKKVVAKYMSRGKIDIFINVNSGEQSGKKVVIDKDLALSYVNAFKEFCEEADIKFDITASRLMCSDAVSIEHDQKDDEEVWQYIAPVIEECMKLHTASRETEGERLKADLLSKVNCINKNVCEIEKIVPENICAYRERLLSKVHEVLDNYDLEENRIIAEIAVYSDKVCVDEETVRLKSHLQEVAKLLNDGGAIGKKMDFIIQEMNREINTIGSKSNELQISKLVVDTKNEIEKIREQIQNIE